MVVCCCSFRNDKQAENWLNDWLASLQRPAWSWWKEQVRKHPLTRMTSFIKALPHYEPRARRQKWLLHAASVSRSLWDPWWDPWWDQRCRRSGVVSKIRKKEEENMWADDGKLMIQSLLADVLKPRDRDTIWTVAYHLIASSVRLPISCWSHLCADHVTSLEVAHPGCRTRLASWRGAGLRQTKNYLLFSKDPHTHIHKNTRSHTPPFPFHTHTHALLRNHILIFWFKNKWRPCFSHCYTKFTMFTRT